MSVFRDTCMVYNRLVGNLENLKRRMQNDKHKRKIMDGYI